MPTPEIVQWKITGETPLFQGNPASMWAEPDPEENKGAKSYRKKPMYAGMSEAAKTAAEQLYIDENGKPYHPCMGFYKALLKACVGRTLGRTPALQAVIQGVRIVDERFTLCDPKGMKPLPAKMPAWISDTRRAINHNKNKETGGVAVVAIRPKWRVWGGVLRLEIDKDIFGSLVGLTELLNIAGHMFGVGVGRRRLRGMQRQKELWSDMGMGRFSAELME